MDQATQLLSDKEASETLKREYDTLYKSWCESGDVIEEMRKEKQEMLKLISDQTNSMFNAIKQMAKMERLLKDIGANGGVTIFQLLEIEKLFK